MNDSVVRANVVPHFPALNLAHLGPEDAQDASNVEPGRVLGRLLCLQHREPDAELFTQQLQQRRVQARLVIMHAKGVAGPNA
ncbi:MAG: hypothetical protein ACJ8H8_22830, partial [Geminicoccaceae bacterium]